MQENLVIVFDGTSARRCSERALVLQSLEIPHRILRDGERAALAVPAAYAERAKYELWQYDKENVPSPAAAGPRPLSEHDGSPGVIAYLLVVCLVGWLAGESAGGFDWLAAGRVDGELIREGEWWRLVTALTLHAGIRHLLGNIGFGLLFGFLAGRLAGSGVAWLAIAVSSAAANAINTLLLDSTHRSIGASTAVFAALGIVSGFVWRGRYMAQDRWPYRLGPVIGGIALLAYTGTGDENTDIGAHLMGFCCGFGAGMLLVALAPRLGGRHLQVAAGVAAIALVVFAWVAALGAAAA